MLRAAGGYSTAHSRPVVAADCAAHRADGQDDVACLMPRLDVSGRLDHLLQRVAPIDDRPILPRLDELLEEEDVLLRVLGYPQRHPLVAEPPGQQDQEWDVPQEPQIGCEVEPARLQ